MFIATLRMEFHIPTTHSLKEKRSVVKSVIARLQNEFNASVAEVDAQDTWQRAVIGVACVGAQQRYLEGQLDSIIRWLETNRPDVMLMSCEREML